MMLWNVWKMNYVLNIKYLGESSMALAFTTQV